DHSVRRVTAASVTENVRWVLDPDTQAYQRVDYEAIQSMEAVDSRTVRFRLRESFSPFLGLLANGTGLTDVQCLVRRDPRTRPVGAGPYELVEWLPGDRLELRAFPDDHGQAIPRVTVFSCGLL